MWLLVGLGNPGREYEDTRHNIGFQVIDEAARDWGSSQWKGKFKGDLTEANVAEVGKVILLKPQTFMNCSGDSVQSVCAFYKIAPKNVLVVHDEIDIPFGQLRIKQAGGEGGHNGLKSIKQRLGTNSFLRLRCGVGRPKDCFQGDVSSWVLGRFDKDEVREVPAICMRSVRALEVIMRDGLKKAQNEFN